MVALCLLSYIRKFARRVLGQYRGSSCGKLLKSSRRFQTMRSIDRCPAPMHGTVGLNKTESKKARILAESGPAAKQSLEVVRLCAFLSRMQPILVPIKLLIACWEAGMRGCVAHARRTHRRGTDERDQTLGGSGCSDDVPGFHDEASAEKVARLSEGADCK